MSIFSTEEDMRDERAFYEETKKPKRRPAIVKLIGRTDKPAKKGGK